MDNKALKNKENENALLEVKKEVLTLTKKFPL